MQFFFGPYRLDSSLPLLFREAEVVPVPARVLAGLVLLVERRHTAVSKRELMDALWPDSFVEEGSLAQLISTLRKVLAPGFPEVSPILTIPKLGYRFTAEVREAADDANLSTIPAVVTLPETAEVADEGEPPTLPEGVPEGPLQEHRPAQTVVPGRRWLWAAALLACLAGTVAGVARWRDHDHGAGNGGTARPPGGGERHVLAVLPFEDLTGQPSSAWVGLATEEMLATDLRLSKGVRVLSGEDVHRALEEQHVTAAASAGAQSLRRLGADLDCEHAVTGAYLLHDGRIRLDVRMVNLQTGATEQEAVFQRPEKELLPMLAEVRQQVSRGLGVAQDRDEALFAQAGAVNPEAYRLFAEGVARTRAYDGKGASALLERSVALDPAFPLAHLQLSEAWTERGEETRAREEAERALALAGRLPREQQLLIQARVQSARHAFSEAAETYGALSRFYPDNPEYGRQLVQALASAGRSDEAVRAAEALVRMGAGKREDPMTDSVLADLYSTRGDWVHSLEWAQRGAEESRRRGATILYERLLTTESQAEFYMNRYADAEAQTREALALAQQYGDVSGELRALNREGQIATAQQNWAGAEAALTAALAMEQRYDQRQREVHTLLTLSRLSQRRGQIAPAVRYASQALQQAQGLGLADVVTEAKLQVAVLDGEAGHDRAASARLAEVSTEAAQIRDVYLQGQARQALAKAAAK